MTYYVGSMPVGEHLAHYGTKGMKWGRRLYQNPDGSLTAAGKARYGIRDRIGGFYKKHKRAINTALGVAAVAGAAYAGSRTKAGKALIRKARSGIIRSGLARKQAKLYAKTGIEGQYLTARAKRRIDRRNSNKVLGGMFDSATASMRRNRIGATVDDAFAKNKVARARRDGGRWLARGTKRFQKPSVTGSKSSKFLNDAFDEASAAGRRARIGATVDDAFAKNKVARARRDGGRWLARGTKRFQKPSVTGSKSSKFLNDAFDEASAAGRRARIGATVDDAFAKNKVARARRDGGRWLARGTKRFQKPSVVASKQPKARRNSDRWLASGTKRFQKPSATEYKQPKARRNSDRWLASGTRKYQRPSVKGETARQRRTRISNQVNDSFIRSPEGLRNFRRMSRNMLIGGVGANIGYDIYNARRKKKEEIP